MQPYVSQNRQIRSIRLSKFDWIVHFFSFQAYVYRCTVQKQRKLLESRNYLKNMNLRPNKHSKSALSPWDTQSKRSWTRWEVFNHCRKQLRWLFGRGYKDNQGVMSDMWSCYTDWLQWTSTEASPVHVHYLHFCPWLIGTMEDLGACREIALNQSFHSLSHKIAKSKDVARLDENNYKRTRFAEASDEQKKALLQEKKIYKVSANERRKEIRKGETADETTRRFQRRHLEPRYVSQSRGPNANSASKCSYCHCKGHTTRTCKHDCASKPTASVKCHTCRFPRTIASVVPRRGRRSSEKLKIPQIPLIKFYDSDLRNKMTKRA